MLWRSPWGYFPILRGYALAKSQLETKGLSPTALEKLNPANGRMTLGDPSTLNPSYKMPTLAAAFTTPYKRL